MFNFFEELSLGGKQLNLGSSPKKLSFNPPTPRTAKVQMIFSMNDRFLFDLYDADLSGYLSLTELSEGLASAMTNSKLRSSSSLF